MKTRAGEPLGKVYYDEKLLGKTRADMTSHTRELLKTFAGSDWYRGATRNVLFIRPAMARETVMQNGKVLEKAPGSGQVRIMVDIAAERETGDQVVVGRASVRSGARAAYIKPAHGTEHVHRAR